MPIISNISELKHYVNFKNSGLLILESYLKELLNCKVNFQHQKIADFEAVFHIDISTNLKRYYYVLDDNRIVITIKAISEKNIIGIMPVLFEGNNLRSIKSYLFEQIASSITIQMSKCNNHSFHGGTSLLGEELEKLVIARCFAKKAFDPSRIAFLISYIERLSSTTFEGHNFTTGFILSRSIYDYKSGKSKERKGSLYSLERDYFMIRNLKIDKRFWYLVDGEQSYYLLDQTLIVKNAFFCDNITKSCNNYFNSYSLKGILYGFDIAFRVISNNQISIMNSDGIEFVKIENLWKIRDYNYLSTFISSHIRLKKQVKTALIYYIMMCSKKHISSIIWIPKYSDEKSIDDLVPTKSSLFHPNLSITSTNQSSIIERVLSSDGVTIINKNGTIIYHGGIVDLNASLAKGLAGTGETATRLLSQNGVSVKISQDGNIKIFISPTKEPLVF